MAASACGKLGVALLLSRVEAQVLQHQHVARPQRGRLGRAHRRPPCRVAKATSLPSSSPSLLGRGLQAELRHRRLTLRASQVAHQDQLAAAVEHRLDRGQRHANSAIVGDLLLIVQRHVEIDPHQNGLARSRPRLRSSSWPSCDLSFLCHLDLELNLIGPGYAGVVRDRSGYSSDPSSFSAVVAGRGASDERPKRAPILETWQQPLKRAAGGLPLGGPSEPCRLPLGGNPSKGRANAGGSSRAASFVAIHSVEPTRAICYLRPRRSGSD